MMLWSFWSFILGRLSKAQGFLDPTVVFSSLQRFSKPSEVWVPAELLRSGAVLHARGLINSQAIQHNLDWIWPFWVERQFNPQYEAFIPRAFSMTHINLTYRNWTAIGVPAFHDFPLIDPRGLLTPFFDGWSLDAWIIGQDASLIPSRLPEAEQKINFLDTLAVTTLSQSNGLALQSCSEVKVENGIPVCHMRVTAAAAQKAWLIISVRPYNAEGISFIHDIKRLPDAEGWQINRKEEVHLQEKPLQYVLSNYELGDIYDQIRNLNEIKDHGADAIACPVGMATSAALYKLAPNEAQMVTVKIPLSGSPVRPSRSWSEYLQTSCELKVPDKHFQFLFEAALRTLILHTPGDVFPGPFTYKRFWFRDAAFILQAMIAAGLLKDTQKLLDRFTHRQTNMGYFKSQEGEWDSNGQAIWIMARFAQMTNTPLKSDWWSSIYHGAKWIHRKRQANKKDDVLHDGLLPAGFSAEHFGPSDYYYWDDFWSVAGLKAAAAMGAQKHPAAAKEFTEEADHLLSCIDRSIAAAGKRLNHPGIPASPSRRMDGGAIGSMVASYPLQLWSSRDKRILYTAYFLMSKSFLEDGFYHEISHSGINVYLSLHVAQVLLRAGDPKFFDIVRSMARLASPTGQWPEAIHPRTKGGCMGDGQHVWAAAEWVMMIRNMFVREEENRRLLVLGSGIPEEWLKKGELLLLGPTLTSFGKISVAIQVDDDRIRISWDAEWYGEPPAVEVGLPGYKRQLVTNGQHSVELRLDDMNYGIDDDFLRENQYSRNEGL